MREAEAHFVAERHAAARPLLEALLARVPGHPAVLHLYGLVLSRLGDLENARRVLEAAQRALPRDPQIANNLGNLLSRLGEHEAALAAYDAAVAADAGFAPAHLHRAMMLDELGRYDEARSALALLHALEPPTSKSLLAAASIERNSGNLRAAAARLEQALAVDANDRTVRRARTLLATDLGEADAAERHRRALADDPEDRELLIGYVSAAETKAARRDALDRLRAVLARAPDWRAGHRVLAEALWEDGDRSAFAATYEPLLEAHWQNAGLWKDYVEALGNVDDFAGAAELCMRAATATTDPAFTAAAFGYRSAAGQLEAAEDLLAQLPAGAVSPLALAKHRLRQRDVAAAEPLLAEATGAAPDDIEAWALRSIAWQLLGDPRFHWLNGQDGLIRVDELPLAPGEIAAIADRLRLLHAGSRQKLGQSVRGGTQTLGNLFDREEEEIVRLRTVIAGAVERYRTALPPTDPMHPVLKHRDSRLGFAGSWSIRLTGGGFHIQHIHPKGILSAATYWAVPPLNDELAGWIEIGGTPPYLGLDLTPVRSIAPKPGRLVLFPSTLHHGTRPFAAGERISVAFDVVPIGPRRR